MPNNKSCRNQRKEVSQIKYVTRWISEGYDIGSFSLSRSFSIENYLRLFLALYDRCKWSSNNTIRTFKYLLENRHQHQNLFSLNKEEKWLIDLAISKDIGKELFIEKLLKEGNEDSRRLFEMYSQLTTSLSLHLISQYERHGIIQAKQHLSFFRYQLMTEKIFHLFLSLFKKTGSDVNQQILPYNIHSIISIIDIVIYHLQQSTNTLQIIISYGIYLLQSAEQHPNKQQREIIQRFATNIIKQCYGKSNSLTIHTSSIGESYPETRLIFAYILISDLYPKLVSKSILDELNNSLNSPIVKAWRLPQIDSFINSFFTKSLCSSTKLQSSFKSNIHSSIISFYLKQKSTRFERVNQLINNIHRIFFIDQYIQRIVLRSQQYRQFIDHLIQDKSLTVDKLSNEECKLAVALTSEAKNLKQFGLNNMSDFRTSVNNHFIEINEQS
ncbi:unnamed protein product [Rotaria sordida]|uniref:Uncharacterized protein n=1 Tax=Rotaria sordida TaxID=392033 RepID=A0A813QWB3_9BILA|nr:unnamed protein product [Rotaria sordida]CAF0782976.1 unnamed protein product [Rotaria sordida]